MTVTRTRFRTGGDHVIEWRRRIERVESDPLMGAALFGNWEAVKRLMKAGVKAETLYIPGPWEITIDGRPASMEQARALMEEAPEDPAI